LLAGTGVKARFDGIGMNAILLMWIALGVVLLVLAGVGQVTARVDWR
jgi:hypothetical protein